MFIQVIISDSRDETTILKSLLFIVFIYGGRPNIFNQTMNVARIKLIGDDNLQSNSGAILNTELLRVHRSSSTM